MKTIASSVAGCWERVYRYVNKAVVFIDSVSAELLHWQGGLLKLLNVGAFDVKEFSSFEAGGKSQQKGVFIISSPLEGVTKEILRDIIHNSHFQYVIVLTTVSAGVHTFIRTGVVEDDSQFYEQVEDRLLEWMGNMNYTAEVFHLPLCAMTLDNSVFLTPGCSELFPLITSDLHQVELQYQSRQTKSDSKEFEDLKDIDFGSLPKDLQVLYKCFVSSVDSLLTDLGVKEDIYSLGCTAGLLATELESYPPARTRRKALTNKASVVFMDRTLDLASVASHNTDTLLDKMRQVLPRLPGHEIDVQIDMAPLCKVHRESGSPMISPGCLATQTGSQGQLHSLMTAKHKEALMEVNRQLVEAASQSNLPLSLKGRPTRVTAEQLETTVSLFRGKYSEISAHLEPVQVAMATVQTLTHARLQHCDELIGVEKGLLQSLCDPGGPGALSQILKMIQKKESEQKRTFSLDDVLCSLVYVYSLAGPQIVEQGDDEQEIQDALVARIMEESENLSPLIKSIVGNAVNDSAMVGDIVEDMWEKLLSIASARQHLKQFKSVLDPGSAISPAFQNPLCRQVVDAIFSPEKKDLVDVEFKSSGLKDMLKSGFGLFRSVAKPRPSDHPLLILFIIGGISCTEVKQIREVVNQYKPDTQVVIGSTKLLTPEDTVRCVLTINNVNPGSGS